MKFIEVHMPLDDYFMLMKSHYHPIDTEKWQVFGVCDEEITAQIRYLYKQIKILKSNEKKAIKTNSKSNL